MDSLPTDIATLVALVRRDPGVLARLFQERPDLAMQVTQQLSAAPPSIETGGGAVVHDAVNTGGGAFIGRDFVTIVVQSTPAGLDSEDARHNVELYLQALITDLSGLKLGDISGAQDKTRHTPLQLGDVYVGLDTTTQVEIVPEPENRLQGRYRHVSALEALSNHREFTLLGKPGSGKSTFGAHVLLTLAQAWQGQSDALTALGPDWSFGPLLPIRVTLRRFAAQLPPGDAPVQAGDLWSFIVREVMEAGYGLSASACQHLRAIATRHGALFLLDGLDECGTPERRSRVQAAVESLERTAGSKCRFIVTARPYAWPTGPDPAFGVYELADLNDKQIEVFIRRWYNALQDKGWQTPADAQRRAEDLLTARARPDLRQMAVNPLLLTLMATLHTNRGRLPDDRADLYNESVELLLLRWNQQIGADRALLDELAQPHLKLSDVREVLEELAFQIHDENTGRQGTADIGEGRLLCALRPLVDGKLDKAAIVVDYVEARAGLLIGQGPKATLKNERQFSFPHRTFQEFLAACHLAAKDDFAAETVRLARSAPDHWQVVLPLAARMARAERGASAADELLGGASIEEVRTHRKMQPSDWRCALLAGQQLQEIGTGSLRKSERVQRIVTRTCGWLVAMLAIPPDEGGLSAPLRAHAGDTLSTLGDPRFDPARFHLPVGADLGFVAIPGRTDLRFARYLTTVAQFRAYLAASGREAGDSRALRDPDQRPVRYVDQAEALAYCAWLTDSGLLPTGWHADLPEEAEWEHASRGGQSSGSAYWWGNDPDPERANYVDSGIGDTSVVGCVPANGYGLSDMLGNVFEWTRSPYSETDSDPVVRGGAFVDSADDARCASRYWNPPDLSDYYLGFRVVLRCSPV